MFKSGDIVEVAANLRNVKSTLYYIGEPAEIVAVFDNAYLIRLCDERLFTVETDCIREIEMGTEATVKQIDNNELAQETLKTVEEPIKAELGTRLRFAGGRDYIAPTVLVVPSTFKDAEEHERALHISQGKSSVSLSLATLKQIIKWAERS